jgi:hypothetical protein
MTFRVPDQNGDIGDDNKIIRTGKSAEAGELGGAPAASAHARRPSDAHEAVERRAEQC